MPSSGPGSTSTLSNALIKNANTVGMREKVRVLPDFHTGVCREDEKCDEQYDTEVRLTRNGVQLTHGTIVLWIRSPNLNAAIRNAHHHAVGPRCLPSRQRTEERVMTISRARARSRLAVGGMEY